MQLFEQTTMFLHFDELLRKRLGKVVHFVKKHEKSWIWSKLATFWKHYHVLTFRWTFQQKVARSASIREKARKIIDLAKTLQLFEQTTMPLHFDELFRKKLQKVRHFVKKHEKPSIWPNLASFGANYHVLAFSWTFQQEVAKSASFREKAREIIDLTKTMQLFEQTTMFLHFDELLRKKLGKVVHFVKKHEISWIWSKLATFWKHYHVLTFRWTFQQKVARSASIREKARKIIDLVKTLQLFEQTTMSLHFDELFRKKLQKVRHFVKKHEKPSIWPKLASFGANYHVLAFSWTFQQEVAKSASFREKAREIIDLAKTMQLFEQTTMFLHFDELLRKKLGKVVHFVKKHEISWIWSKLATFWKHYHVLTFRWTFQQKVAKTASFHEKARKLIDLAKTMQLLRTKYHVLVFGWTFQQKVAKSGSFREKARKTIDLAKTCIFWSKLPCFGIFINFSARSCKKCLISWKSTRNHRFGQNFATFGTNYHVFAFRWTFQEKVTKRASFREKERKIIDLAKTLQLFEQTTMSLHFDELFRKKLQKVRHFVKKHEKPSIWPKLASFGANYHVLAFSWTFQQEVAKSAISWKSTRNHRFGQNYASFRTNYHVFAFRWTFKEKVGKSGSFREKARKIMDLVKTCNFLKTLPCFDVSMNFSAKSCKNRLISWKSTKTHRFGQNYATSSNKVPCFGVWMNFSAKGCKKRLISWKSTKKHRFGQNFATFRTNYHVFAFRWTFQEKVTKRASFREKERKIIDLAKTLQLFEQTTMSLHFDELFRKKLEKVRHFVKKHEKPSIWPKLASFRANYHVLAFSWTFQQEVAKSASFREKAREIIDLAKTMQLFGQTTMFLHFDELLRKRLGKVVHFVKKHEKSWIWSKLATFWKHYHVLTFRWTFQQKVAKTASFH